MTKDGTSTVIMFTLLDGVDKQEAAKNIKTKIQELDISENIYFGGLPFMMNDIANLIMSDIVRLIPITFLLIILHYKRK